MQMNFQPINDRVFVEQIYEEETTSGGIVIPESATEKPTRGIVRFIGEGGYLGSTFRPTQLKIGDVVLFGKHAGNIIKLDGKEYRILLEEDIFGILRN